MMSFLMVLTTATLMMYAIVSRSSFSMRIASPPRR